MPDEIEELGPAQIEELGPSSAFPVAEELGPVPKSLKNANDHERSLVAGAIRRAQEHPFLTYFERVGEAFSKMPGMAKEALEDPNPITGLLTAGAVITKPVGAIVGPAIRGAAEGAATLGTAITGKPVSEDEYHAADITGKVGGALAEGLLPIPGIKGPTAVERDVAQIAKNAAKAKGVKPTRVVDPDTGTVVDKNPPAEPALQEEYLKTANPDPQAQAAEVAAREGVPTPTVEVKPDAPISKTEVVDPKARLKEIRGKMKVLSQRAAQRGGLSKDDGELYAKLGKEFESLTFDLGIKPIDVSKFPAQPNNTLAPETIGAAHGDLVAQKSIYQAITEAAQGVFMDAETAVDKIMKGENPGISARAFYDRFTATREALRKQFGETVTLFRAQGKQRQKPTTNWATTEEYAKQFGDNIEKREVPIDNVIAVNVGRTGKYHEVIVGDPPPPTIKVTIEPGTPGEVATRIEHEVGQHVPEKLGMKPPPVENNNAIVLEALIKDKPDGFTFAPDGTPIETGYSYSPYKNREWKTDKPPNAAMIDAFMKQNKDLLDLPGHNIGGWFNKKNGKWYLDVSKNTMDINVARAEGEAANQLAIFDHANLQDIPLNLRIPQDIAETLLREGISKNAVEAAGRLFVDGTIERDTSKLISDQVMEAVSSGKVDLGALQSVLDRNGVSLEEFGRGMLRVKASDAGRTLQRYSNLQRYLNNAVKNNIPALARAIDKEASPMARLYWRYGSVRDIWRGLLTSQFSTAIRNVWSQTGRFGIDAIDKTLSAGIQKLMGKEAQAGFDTHRTLSPLDGFEEFFSLIHGGKNKKLADELISQVDDVGEKLFTTYNSDICTRIGLSPYKADKLLKGAQEAVGHLNWANQAQEFMFRRANLVASLETKLSKLGKSLPDLLQKKEAADFFETGVGKQILGDVIEETLSKTFAQSPKYGTAFSHLIAFINRVPGASIVVPFPRFIYNSSKFFFEHSPFGLLKLLSPAERAAIAKGDVATYSKAITGMLMFGAAYAARKSEFAGDKFYEFKGPGGTTVDMRPFNPYLGYLLLADWMIRAGEGTLQDDKLTEFAEAALSANVRAGTGLYLLDQAGRMMSSRSNPDKAGQAGARLAGEFAAGFATPIQQLRDVMSEFDDHLKVQRDVNDSPFTGPILQKMPFDNDLPEKESPMQADAPREVSPALKQATGFRLIEPKNDVVKELDRLGLSEFEMIPKSGDKTFDRLVAAKMGPMVEEELPYITKTSEYAAMDNIQKVNVMKEQFRKLHARAIKEAKNENPEAYATAKEARKPWFEKALVEQHPTDVNPEALEEEETP